MRYRYLLGASLLSPIFVLGLLFGAPLAVANSDPYLLVEQVAGKTFSRIKSEQADIQRDPDHLKVIVEEELLPYIDYKFAALKVLGKHYRSVPKTKMPEYFQVFRRYLVATYAAALVQYDDQTVEFEQGKDLGKRKDVTVRAVIKDQQRPDINIAFKVRRNAKTKDWRAYDMIAEGISVVASKRSELASIIRQDGIDKVIQLMRKRNDTPLKLQQQPAQPQ